MKNKNNLWFFAAPVLLLISYGFWYLSVHNFVSVTIKTSHRTQLTMLWSDTITAANANNISQFKSSEITIYPHKRNYIFALPKSFDFNVIKSLVISAQDRLNIETVMTRFYIFDKGNVVYENNHAKTFRSHFLVLDDSVSVSPKGYFRLKALKERGYVMLQPSILANAQKNNSANNK